MKNCSQGNSFVLIVCATSNEGLPPPLIACVNSPADNI